MSTKVMSMCMHTTIKDIAKEGCPLRCYMERTSSVELYWIIGPFKFVFKSIIFVEGKVLFGYILLYILDCT